MNFTNSTKSTKATNSTNSTNSINVGRRSTIHDAGGLRVAERVNDVWRFSIFDIGGKCVAEYGGPPSTDDGGVKYVLSDWQGSTRAVINNAGFATARTDYTAYGENITSGVGLRTTTQGFGASDDLRQKYALTERDDATGLDHTPWRKHESNAGRWTSPDPYNGSMSLADPQSFNRYSYVGSDPTNFIDPSGLKQVALVFTTCEWAPDGEHQICTQRLWITNIGSDGTTVPDFGGGGGSPQQNNASPCAKMAARAQTVANDNVRDQIRNTPRGKSTYAVALPFFDYNFNTLYIGHVVDGSVASIKALGWDGGKNSSAPDERGQQDFKENFLDSDFSWNSTKAGADQVHHFAAYFSAGMNGAALSSYGHMASDTATPLVGRGIFNGANTGDLNLASAAYSLGKRIRKQPNLLYKIGDLIRNEFCI